MSTYKVQAGDTLGKIAKKFYGDASRFSAIVAANSIRNPDKLRSGRTCNSRSCCECHAGGGIAGSCPIHFWHQ